MWWRIYPATYQPSIEKRPNLSTEHQPPSTKRIHTKYTEAELKAFASLHKHIAPKDR
ncbi:hypothetical protein JCM19232_164 [Vibrio ishigakensis]|uniref:Uncharacterized protein n=1 Tax=Vibrio ishigakensis TaxID=1481914 RepID=A0A0B8P0T9_9VIBR|nr:hypothetical protein JCM19232_164 [Vibrio ishigakensis]